MANYVVKGKQERKKTLCNAEHVYGCTPPCDGQLKWLLLRATHCCLYRSCTDVLINFNRSLWGGKPREAMVVFHLYTSFSSACLASSWGISWRGRNRLTVFVSSDAFAQESCRTEEAKERNLFSRTRDYNFGVRAFCTTVGCIYRIYSVLERYDGVLTLQRVL